MKITGLFHPRYEESLSDYLKWRLAYLGGRTFIDKYLEKFDAREDHDDFCRRRKLSYNPAFAKQAINEIRNNVYQRMTEVTRIGGSKSYQSAIAGEDGGVDLMGSSMNTFLGQNVLPEMLTMGRVGVYVDMPNFDPLTTLADVQKPPRPYLYYFWAEDIINWAIVTRENELYYTRLLLRERRVEIDPVTQMPYGEYEVYRFMKLIDNKVEVEIYIPSKDDPNDQDRQDILIDSYTLNIPRIPFVLFDLGDSLMKDISDYQIGLLNLSSSDLHYALKSNFPFYTEPYDPKTSDLYRKAGPVTTTVTVDGKVIAQEAANTDGNSQERTVGVTRGIRFPINSQPPAFIHPSPEPLRASMEKQDRMIMEIRQLLDLAMANLNPSRASAESKQMDQGGMESGLAAIGLELQGGEQEIAKVWEMYLSNGVPAQITYPTTYKLKPDSQRLSEASDLKDLKAAVPSKTFQKEVSKKLAASLFEGRVAYDKLNKMYAEIDKANYVTSDPLEIQTDMNLGLVSSETASNARGYDGATEVPKAQKEHAERLATIAVSQTKGISAARGTDTNPTDPSAKDEKTVSQNPDKLPTGETGTRS